MLLNATKNIPNLKNLWSVKKGPPTLDMKLLLFFYQIKHVARANKCENLTINSKIRIEKLEGCVDMMRGC